LKLNNSELYDFLIEKDIWVLYHANTFRTSLTYFQEYGLLSRGAVESRGLLQTVQSSDEIDKVINVWDDVFLDTVDLHSFFHRQNYYGPILFEFSVNLVKNEDYDIWITKNNPINWKKETPNDERYFNSIDDLKTNWDSIPRQRKMITIRNNSTPILFEYVRRIIVDDPKVTLIEGEIKTHVFNDCVRNLKEVIIAGHPLKGKFMTRDCKGYCYCTSNYLHQLNVEEIKRLFL
jgi:hypothetical protein